MDDAATGKTSAKVLYLYDPVDNPGFGMVASDKLAIHDDPNISLACFVQVTDELPICIVTVLKVAAGNLVDFAGRHTSPVNSNKRIRVCTARCTSHETAINDTDTPKRMGGTYQLARAFRKQTLIDLSMEVGAYTSTAFRKGAVLNESRQGRPLLPFRHKAAMAVLECTAYHGGCVDRKGDIGKIATPIEDIGIFFSSDQLKVFRQRHRLFEVTLIEDYRFITISTESNAFRNVICTIRLCDLPSASTQNESCIGNWLSLGEGIQTILKFAIQKVTTGDEFATFEFNMTVVLAEKKEITGRLLPNESTMNECNVSIASYAK